GHWVLLGSANWDVRSLRLNFELNVEAYGRHFAEEMGRVIQNKLRGAREVTLAEVEGRSYPAKTALLHRSLVLAIPVICFLELTMTNQLPVLFSALPDSAMMGRLYALFPALLRPPGRGLCSSWLWPYWCIWRSG